MRRPKARSLAGDAVLSSGEEQAKATVHTCGNPAPMHSKAVHLPTHAGHYFFFVGEFITAIFRSVVGTHSCS